MNHRGTENTERPQKKLKALSCSLCSLYICGSRIAFGAAHENQPETHRSRDLFRRISDIEYSNERKNH